jgi:sulfite reductase (ferredoxin)
LCLARNAARACAAALETRGVSRDTLDAMQFHINGCPNACGQQPVGAIGCYGASQRVAGRLVPSYVVTIGGRCGADGVRFGTAVGKVPAAALPAAMGDLAVAFASQRAPGESFLAYADRMGIESFKTVLSRHAVIPDFSERPDFYRDVGATECFSLDGCGSGECGAGSLENIKNHTSKKQTATGDAPIAESASCCLPGCVCTPPH